METTPRHTAATEKLAEDQEFRERVAMEAADVAIYLIGLEDQCGFDLVEAVHRKLEINEARFSVPEKNPDDRR